MTFNHKKAWRELAAPALMQLPVPVLQLVWQVIRDSRGLQQNNDLSMPWPDSDLKKKFEEIDTKDLAKASRIVWAAGHWHPGTDNWFRLLMRTGAYWKFASYADEILRVRCKLAHQRARNNFTFEIREGFIRVCYEYDKTWAWHNVALATLENLEALRPIVPEAYKTPNRKDDDTWQDEIKKAVNAYWGIINEAVENMKTLRPTDKPIAEFFDLKGYHSE